MPYGALGRRCRLRSNGTEGSSGPLHNELQKDFHGYRDFYDLIKGVANELAKSGDIGDIEIVEKII